MSKSKKIWEKIFKDREFVFDFSNTLILKNEFKTGKSYSWNYDFYDYDDEDAVFIANEEMIKKRNQEPIFDFKKNRYISIKNQDSTYSILSPTKLIEKNNPLNYDLFLSNLINNYHLKKFFILTLSFNKMKPFINDIFISFINETLKINLEFEYLKIENNIWKDRLFFLIDKNKFSAKKVLEISTILKPLIKLFIQKSNEKFKTIWISDDINDDDWFFNIYLYSTNNKEDNIFQSCSNQLINYVESPEEKIFLNNDFRKELIDEGILPNDFTIAYSFDTNHIYSYNFINSKFNSFYLFQKNKKNKI